MTAIRLRVTIPVIRNLHAQILIQHQPVQSKITAGVLLPVQVVAILLREVVHQDHQAEAAIHLPAVHPRAHPAEIHPQVQEAAEVPHQDQVVAANPLTFNLKIT